MRCEMKTEKEAAVSRKTEETKTNMVASIEFAVRASLREEHVDADFVHSILGSVFATSEELGGEEDAGYIKASLVQFGEGIPLASVEVTSSSYSHSVNTRHRYAKTSFCF
jgi:hypothetical protein